MCIDYTTESYLSRKTYIISRWAVSYFLNQLLLTFMQWISQGIFSPCASCSFIFISITVVCMFICLDPKTADNWDTIQMNISYCFCSKIEWERRKEKRNTAAEKIAGAKRASADIKLYPIGECWFTKLN